MSLYHVYLNSFPFFDLVKYLMKYFNIIAFHLREKCWTVNKEIAKF